MKKKALEEAYKHLRKDARFKKVLARYTLEKSTRPKDPFQALVRSIIYQQLSGKAAGTILRRFLELFPLDSDKSRNRANTKGVLADAPFPTPEQVLKLKDAKFKSVGISGQKMGYLRDLAARFTDGTIEPKKFPKMTDEEIREHLIRVKGVGRWTADMFLMFTLYRPDVLPTGDLAIQKGFQRVFNMKKMPTPEQMEKLAKSWSPHRTVASLYLWRILDEENGGW